MQSLIGRRGAVGGAVAASLPFLGRPARAERSPTIRIGVLTELSGPNSVATGQGSTIATRMAVEDIKRANPGLAVEVLEADHQTKADIAVSIAREWLDRARLDALLDAGSRAIDGREADG